MARIALLTDDRDLAQRWSRSLDELGAVECHEEPASLITDGKTDLPELVVLAPDLEDPLLAVALLQHHDRDLEILVVVERPDAPAFEEVFRISPFARANVRTAVVEFGQPPDRNEVRAALTRARARRRHRAWLAAADRAWNAGRSAERAGTLLDRLLRHLPVGVAVTGPEGAITACNRKLAAMVGPAHDRLTGRRLADVLGVDAPDAVDDVLRHAIATTGADSGATRELNARDGNGARHTLRLSATSVTGDRNTRDVLVVIEDVTDLVQAQRALRAGEARFRGLFEGAPVPLLEFGTGPEGPELRGANGAALQLLGSSSEDELRAAAPGLLGGILARLPAGGLSAETHGTEHELRPRDGPPRQVVARWTTTPGPDDARPSFLLSLADVTALRRAEEERRTWEHHLLETQRRESLGVMAAGVAHDFNNILTAILGNTGLVLESHDLPPPVSVALDRIRRSAERAAELARQMLVYSGANLVSPRPHELGEVVDDVLEIVRGTLPDTVELVVGGTRAWAHCDSTQVHQVVLNLVLNASEALPQGGPLQVRTGTCTMTAEDLEGCELGSLCTPGTLAYVEVADGGTGMDESSRRRMFDPFFTTKFTGRGLGMAAVHGIVRSHGGAIEVESVPGRGTRIRVLLPTPAAAGDAGPREHRSGTDARRRILIVDEQDAVRGILQRALEQRGYGTLPAASPREALDALARTPSDIAGLVLDAGLAASEAAALLPRLRASRPDLPVILVGGTDPAAHAGLLDRHTHLLQEPLTSRRLPEVMAHLLEPRGA